MYQEKKRRIRLNRFNEYETNDRLEMSYFHDLGFSFELDKNNPQRVVMIVKEDARLVQDKLNDLWDRNNDFLKHYNSIQEMKRMLWVGGQYDPEMSVKRYENKDERREIKSVHQ